MFGIKIMHVFRSRWHALLWSAGILMTAYCSIPAPGDDSDTPTQDQVVQAQQAASAWSAANGSH